MSLGLLRDNRTQDREGTRVVLKGYKEEQPGEEKEGKEGRGRCAGSVAVSKLALVPVGDVLCCAVLAAHRILRAC